MSRIGKTRRDPQSKQIVSMKIGVVERVDIGSQSFTQGMSRWVLSNVRHRFSAAQWASGHGTRCRPHPYTSDTGRRFSVYPSPRVRWLCPVFNQGPGAFVA